MENNKNPLSHFRNTAMKTTNLAITRLYGARSKVLLVKGDLKSDSINNANIIKPDDQLELSKTELEEEHARVLMVKSPKKPPNLIRFDYKERKFVKVLPNNDPNLHLNIVGNLISHDTDEAKSYLEKQKQLEVEKRNFYPANFIDDYVDQDGNKKFRVLKNRFTNYDRATQTPNLKKDVSVETDKPEKANFSDNVSPYILHQIYAQDYQDQLNQKQMKIRKPRVNKKLEERMMSAVKKRYEAPKNISQKTNIKSMLESAKLIQRMLAQNSLDEIAHDFKYFEDQSDYYKNEGTLLPLWRFSNESTDKMWITSVSWNKTYMDMFAVSTGSFDFFDQQPGLIVIYSLKNPQHHEFRIETESGCMCVDFNPEFAYLLCAGFYDGTVAVYDLRRIQDRDHSFCIVGHSDRHLGPVWQVQWLDESITESVDSFCSISTDRRVINWTLKDLELHSNLVMNFDQHGDHYIGTCFDFNHKLENTLLIASEQGHIYETSQRYINKILTTYNAHDLSIQAVKWNPYYKRVFLTCSTDWCLKIWDHRYNEPVLIFELCAPVVDASWAPYSSTVFAAITIDGHIYIYDIAVDQIEPLCIQNVLYKKKSSHKLTHIAFNPVHPIILITDDKGHVFSFKLSPNLRSISKEAKIRSTVVINKETYETVKLRQCLMKEFDVEPDAAPTSRKSIDLEQNDIKKMSRRKSDDSDEPRSKSVEFNVNRSRSQSVQFKKETF